MCYACDADKAFYTRGPLENRSHILNWSHSSSTLSFHAHHQCISFMAHQGLRAIVAFCAIQCFTANIKLLHWRRSGWSKTIGQSSPTLLCCKGFQYFSMFSSIMFCNVYHFYAMSLFIIMYCAVLYCAICSMQCRFMYYLITNLMHANFPFKLFHHAIRYQHIPCIRYEHK